MTTTKGVDKKEEYFKKDVKWNRPHPVNTVKRIVLREDRGIFFFFFLYFDHFTQKDKLFIKYQSFLIFASGSSRKTLATFPYSCGLFRSPTLNRASKTITFVLCAVWRMIYKLFDLFARICILQLIYRMVWGFPTFPDTVVRTFA